MTALLLIDLQKGFEYTTHWGTERNNLDAEIKAQKLLHHFRNIKSPIFHIQHDSEDLSSPLRPEHPGHEFMDLLKPLAQEIIIRKKVNSGFIGTNLKTLLDQSNITAIVIGRSYHRSLCFNDC